MAFITYPLDGVEYDAKAAQLFHATRTSGVAHDGFDLSISDGSTVSISPGMGWFKIGPMRGVAFGEFQQRNLGIARPDDSHNRIDAIIVRFDSSANETVIKYVTGVPGSRTGPKPVRTAQIQDLVLYHIHRKAGSPIITIDNITDLRGDPAYCGYMMDELTGVDPTLSKHGYVADAFEVGRQLGMMLTKSAFENSPHVLSISELPKTNVNGVALYRKRWSTGLIEYCSDTIYLGTAVSVSDLVEYAKIVDSSGYRGVVPVQIGEGAVAPAHYCMADIITNGVGRTAIVVYGNPFSVGQIDEGHFSGWRSFAPTEASVLLPEPLPENAPVPGSTPVVIS